MSKHRISNKGLTLTTRRDGRDANRRKARTISEKCHRLAICNVKEIHKDVPNIETRRKHVIAQATTNRWFYKSLMKRVSFQTKYRDKKRKREKEKKPNFLFLIFLVTLNEFCQCTKMEKVTAFSISLHTIT